MKLQKYKVADEDHGVRLDVFLKKHYSGVAREQIKKAIILGKAKVNGSLQIEPKFKVKSGQTVEFHFEPEKKRLTPSRISLKKIYEDSNFLVIEKPAGLIVHPGAGVQEI